MVRILAELQDIEAFSTAQPLHFTQTSFKAETGEAPGVLRLYWVTRGSVVANVARVLAEPQDIRCSQFHSKLSCLNQK